MVTAVSQSLFERLLESFPTDRSYNRTDLKRSAMPGPVSDYLTAAMDARLDEHLLPELKAQGWVDPRNPILTKAHRSYAAVLSEQQRIPVQEWKPLLRQACDNVVRFLVYPGATLADAAVKGASDALEATDVMAALKFYSPYPYFREVMRAYFEQKSVSRLRRDRLEGLVARVDRQMTADYAADEWMQLLRPLLEVVNAAGYGDEVPFQILKAALHEKGADSYLRRLEAFGHEHITRDELRALFAESEPSTETDRTDEVERPPAGAMRERGPERGDERTSERDHEEDGPLPLWKQFERGSTVSMGESAFRAPVPSPSTSEPLWRRFRPESAPVDVETAPVAPAVRARDRSTPTISRASERPSSLADVEQSVLGPRGARNRDLFVKHLFNGDRSDYEATLRSLSDARNWSQASQIIAREVFQKNQVNIYSDPAVAFTDAVESRFRS